MKHIALSLVGTIFVTGTVASAELIGFHLVEWAVDGYGVDGTTTWRLFAEFDNQNDQLTSVGGSPTSNGAIQSFPGFYQHWGGGPTTLSINPYFASMFPSMYFDSWVTIGLEDQVGNYLYHTGLDFTNFEAGGDFFINDGSWSLPHSMPGVFGIGLDGLDNFHVLVGQFTTFGYGSESAPWGQLNLSGFSLINEVPTPWSVDGITFGSPIPVPSTLLLLGLPGFVRRRRQ